MMTYIYFELNIIILLRAILLALELFWVKFLISFFVWEIYVWVEMIVGSHIGGQSHGLCGSECVVVYYWTEQRRCLQFATYKNLEK